MTGPRHEERRPHKAGAASNKSFGGDPLSVPDAADLVTGVFVLVVTVPAHPDPHHRRRVYLQAQPAQRAADRAVERGHHAEVVLCRLVPEDSGRWSA